MSQGNGKPEDHNIVDLASARKKQRTVQPKPNGATKAGKSYPNGKGKGAGGPMPLKTRLVTGVQVIIVLGLVFYMLRLCRGP
jgi:hypothetical protein